MRRFVLCLFALLALPAAASAEPKLDGEFDVSGRPEELALGPGGTNVWFLLSSSSASKELGRITPSGTVTEFDLPKTPADIVAGGGRLWISYSGGIIEVNPADPDTPVDHPVAQIANAQGIAREGDGDLWVVDDADVVEVAANGDFKREIPGKPIGGNTPSGRGIALGSDGRLWWGDFAQKAVQVTDPADESVDAFEVGDGVQEVAPGPAGEIAYTAPQNFIGRMATADGAFTETTNPGGDATGIVFANDLAYWSAEFATDSVARLASDGTLTHPIEFTPDADPRHIAKGANDTLWVGLEDLGAVKGPRIARITGVEPPPPPDPDPDPDPQPGPDPEPGPGPDPGPFVCCAPPPDTTDPVLGALSMSPRAFRVGREATVEFTLSEAATLTVRIERVRRGRGRRGEPCRKRGTGPRCVLYIQKGTLTRTGVEGANEISFKGRVGLRRLRRGPYRMVVVARDDAGNESITRRLSFRIRRPRRARG